MPPNNEALSILGVLLQFMNDNDKRNSNVHLSEDGELERVLKSYACFAFGCVDHSE
jgi:hypothetical protein